jgi:hypothetical protein
VNWIGLAQDRDRLRALVSAVMNLRVKLNDLYSSPNIGRVIIEKNEVGGACSTMWGSRGSYRILVGKLEGKRPLGRPKGRWENNN